MLNTDSGPIAVCLGLTQAISGTRTVDEIYEAALDALADGLGVTRASILLFDREDVMRFVAYRGLSHAYRRAVEGHTPWAPDSIDPHPIVVENAADCDALSALLPAIRAEGIAAMAFIPLVSRSRVIGKFMLYYGEPRALTAGELQLAGVIAAHVAFAVDRTRAEDFARQSDERLRQALDARLAAAEDANRLKDEFLATLSHELRTPLNAILGWVQMLQSGVLTAERKEEAVETIGRNARLQAQLIEDILDVSRIITGKLAIDRLPLLVPQLVEGAITAVLPAAAAKRIHVDRDVAACLPPIEGDPKRLQQVLGNILSNAIKFTPPGGRVAVACAAEPDSIVITVRDSGAGVEPTFLPFIFDRFRQADSRSTRKHGGLGLGLAIARHLIEQHHGTISAHSDGPGEGTTFRIALPVRPIALFVPPAPDRRQIDRVRDARFEDVAVVVVDDERDARELLATLLGRCGARVIQCESAAEALDVLRSTPVQLIVADIAMPDVDGNELIRRARTANIHIPAVAVSAYARPEDRREALAAGYNAYCSKPLDAAEFLRTVHNVLTAAAV
ncbi:MAG TPA: ATP-binding protein [Vicinamibacterales bacterium]|jgi:signal transduction histidine kinase/CheY-like chemotaxis protein